MKRRVLIIALFIILIIGFLYVIYRTSLDPYRNVVKNMEYTLPLNETLSKEEAKEELGYLIDHIRDYHPAYLDGSDHLVDAVEKQYELEVQNLNSKITITELWRASSRIIARLHDGHSKIRNFSDKIKYISSVNEIEKYKIVTIDDIPTTELYNTFLNQTSYELESYVEQQFKTKFLQEDYLQFIGIDTSDGVDIKFETDEGEKVYHYEFVPFEEVNGYEIDVNKEKNQFVYYEIMEENDLALFTLMECTYNDTYLNVLDNFFREVSEKKINNVVVDLRSNSGGNAVVINAFLQYLDIPRYAIYSSMDVRIGPFLPQFTMNKTRNNIKNIAFSGNIYVLISSNTFSSAMNFASTISDNKIGTLVGEIPGNTPTHYGDILQFQMPKSNLYFTLSYKRFYRVDKSKEGEPLIPDYEIEAGKALDKVIEIINK